MSCKFCEDMDFFYQIVCYIPAESGGAIDIPINHCPACGRKLVKGEERVLDTGYVIVDSAGSHHLSKTGIYHSVDKAQQVCDRENSTIYKMDPVFKAVAKVELITVNYEEVEDQFKRLAENLRRKNDENRLA